MIKHTLVIAEAGVNHNGDINLAKKLAYIALESGADIIKYQTYIASDVVSKFAPKAKYQRETTMVNESQLEMVKKLELSFEQFISLKEYCDEIGIEFMSTAFDIKSVHFLDKKINQAYFKIPSGEITNLPLIREIAKTGKPVLLSTGMSNMQEINDAVNILYEYGCNKISIMHCTTEYPAPIDEVNLNVIETFKKSYPDCEIGYSDHTKGIEIPILAVAKGATIIEKHFTIDSTMVGPDHAASLEPHELKEMVQNIRKVEKILGSFEKEPSESEKKNIPIARKSIVAKRLINEGEILTEDNLTTKRPGTGISPMKWDDVIGTYAIRTFDEDEEIEI